jgi:hypothetical protein
VKIFCIGLNKTGTISLHEALEGLGLSSLHWGGQPSRTAVERAIAEDVPMLTYLPEADAYSDIQRLSVSFDVLDEQYPGSKFVMTTRDLDGWIDSRRRHVERNIKNEATGEYDGTFLSIDVDAWTALYERHHADVRAYFAGRPDDLLVFNIIGGEGYERLCPFLGLDLPAEPFPWRHRDASAD